MSKQVISRYEESDYQTVAIARLQEILDAIGIKTVAIARLEEILDAIGIKTAVTLSA